MIGKAIYSKLTSDTDVTALVGTRIYPELSSGLVTPLVVYEDNGGEYVEKYTGAANLKSSNLNLYCIATSYADAHQLAQEVATSLHNQSGTWGGIVVQGAFVHEQSDDKGSLPELGADQVYYMVSLSVLAWYEV